MQRYSKSYVTTDVQPQWQRKLFLCCSVCHTSVLCAHFQERRREFEANLLKIGLELETEDKAVRKPSMERSCPLVDTLQMHTIDR